jgi:hypothetical protein
VGDVSHPSGVEIIATYPDWAEKNERMLEEIKNSLGNRSYDKDEWRKLEYVS